MILIRILSIALTFILVTSSVSFCGAESISGESNKSDCNKEDLLPPPLIPPPSNSAANHEISVSPHARESLQRQVLNLFISFAWAINDEIMAKYRQTIDSYISDLSIHANPTILANAKQYRDLLNRTPWNDKAIAEGYVTLLKATILDESQKKDLLAAAEQYSKNPSPQSYSTLCSRHSEELSRRKGFEASARKARQLSEIYTKRHDPKTYSELISKGFQEFLEVYDSNATVRTPLRLEDGRKIVSGLAGVASAVGRPSGNGICVDLPHTSTSSTERLYPYISQLPKNLQVTNSGVVLTVDGCPKKEDLRLQQNIRGPRYFALQLDRAKPNLCAPTDSVDITYSFEELGLKIGEWFQFAGTQSRLRVPGRLPLFKEISETPTHLEINENGITFYVEGGKCTKPSSFDIRIRETYPPSLHLLRNAIEACENPFTRSMPISFDYSMLQLQPGNTFYIEGEKYIVPEPKLSANARRPAITRPKLEDLPSYSKRDARRILEEKGMLDNPAQKLLTAAEKGELTLVNLLLTGCPEISVKDTKAALEKALGAKDADMIRLFVKNAENRPGYDTIVLKGSLFFSVKE